MRRWHIKAFCALAWAFDVGLLVGRGHFWIAAPCVPVALAYLWVTADLIKSGAS